MKRKASNISQTQRANETLAWYVRQKEVERQRKAEKNGKNGLGDASKCIIPPVEE